jgi:hypothetical protein
MGGAIGIQKPVKCDLNPVFVDEVLIKGELLLKLNKTKRGEFIEFIKSGTWIESLEQTEEPTFISNPYVNAHWRRFGYKSPHCMGGTSSGSNSGRRASHHEPEFDEASTASSPKYTKQVLSESYVSILSFQNLKKSQICCILVAAILPIFLLTLEGGDSEITQNDSEDVNTTVLYKEILSCSEEMRKKMTKRKMSERLEAWLVGAAAMCDSLFLDAFLTCREGSWVASYVDAINDLTALVTLSAVDAIMQESKIFFSNSVHRGVFDKESQLGANLHELFAQDCSPGGAQQVHKAVFGAKAYKRGLIDSDGLCRLRALKPVFDSEGKHIFMLGIESFPFKDDHLSDAPFQQVEDLLLLLPMLIRPVSRL